MTRSIFAGSTDYRDQSLSEIMDDLSEYIEMFDETLEELSEQIEHLKGIDKWDGVYNHFRGYVNYSISTIKKARVEVVDILTGLRIVVENHHVSRLRTLRDVGNKLDNQIIDLWKNQYPPKMQDYGEDYFWHVERLYTLIRGMGVDMKDFANAADRVEDFVGLRSTPESTDWVKTISDTFNKHIISAIIIIIVGFVIALAAFTDAIENLGGRFRDLDNKTVVSERDSIKSNDPMGESD